MKYTGYNCDNTRSFTGYIYYIKHKETEECYIGATIDPQRRIRQHLTKTRYSDPWHKEFSHHPENFTFGILDKITCENMNELNDKLYVAETYFYNKMKPTYNKYVPTKCTLRGSKFSDNRIQKARESHYGSPHKSHIDWRVMQNVRNTLNAVL